MNQPPIPQNMKADMPGAYRLDYNKPSLAMAYVITQAEAENVYEPEAALKHGTLYPELDKPFLAYKGGR